MSENAGYRAFIAGTELAVARRVKIAAASATTPPTVVYAGAGEQHIGVTGHWAPSGTQVAVRLRTVSGSVEIEAAGAFVSGALLYGAANGTVDDVALGSALAQAIEAAGSAAAIVEVVEFGVLSTTAATVSVADAGGFTAAATVEAALAEIYQSALTAKRMIPVRLGSLVLGSTGTPLAVFADGASATPGLQLTNRKAITIRWNNHATPTAVATSIPLPLDLDDTKAVVCHFLVSKTGATLADATTLTVAAYEQTVGALHDADTNFGGATGAVTGDATAKTVAELTRTLAAADISAAPSTLTLLFGPTAGTLGTDDFLLHGAWLEYSAKLLTA
jgi:hypothetical protein